MFEIIPGMGWLFLAYAVGTAFGFFIQDRNGERIVEATIDSLIDNGYLKHRKNADGEIEIMKYDD